MKKTVCLLSALLFVSVLSTNAQTENHSKTKNESLTETDSLESSIKVYYFHSSRRCETCKAVENICQETLQENYADKIPFQSINSDKEKSNPLLKEYKVSGQTLLIVCEDKSVNLTNIAFLNALSNPEKLKKKIVSTIEKMKK